MICFKVWNVKKVWEFYDANLSLTDKANFI